MKKIIHKELSYKITGVCLEVKKELGRFCRERQYADRLEEKLKESNIKYQREYEIKKINANSPIGNRVDFLIENTIIVDLKAKHFITKEDYIQIQRYLQSADLELGLIVNFRDTFLKAKRVLNSEFSGFSDNFGVSDRNSGFTLIEMIIYIAILGVVIAGFMSYSLSVSGVRNKNYSASTVQANGRVALQIITKKIHEAQAVITPSTGAISTQLVLDMTGSNPNITFYVNNGVLYMSESGSVTTTITDVRTNISSLVFTNLSGFGERANVRVEMTIGYNTPNSEKEFGYSKSYRTAASTRP